MADDGVNQHLPETPSPGPPPPAVDEVLPERLRVHILARVLGTTSKRVLEVLAELDGRARSAQSSVDQADAIRVREVLAATAAGESRPIPGAHDAADPAAVAAAEAPADMPLFVAPQPVSREAGSGKRRAADPVTDAEDTDGQQDSKDSEGSTDPDSDSSEADSQDADERPANRRRRRGRRGRGRGRGDQGGPDDDDDVTEPPAEVGQSDNGEDRSASGDESGADGDGDDESVTADGGTRRRRRRKRRKPGSGADDGASPDDPPNTVVHERAPRQKTAKSGSNEIQGISGSTRLEAKRQRRRDGRDAGRRRPPVLTEAEFLARREAVDRVMVVREKVRTEPPQRRCCLHADRGSRGRYRRRALRDVGRFGLIGRKHLPRDRPERVALDGGGFRRYRPWPKRCPLRRRGQLGGRRTGRVQSQDRAGPQTGRLRRGAGEQGPGRATRAPG